MDCMQFGDSKSWRTLSWFQYRKRYGLHAMLCLTRTTFLKPRFQYRKRYGLHAMRKICFKGFEAHPGFNTASGMDCMQWAWRHCASYALLVSIPQAVWIACNAKNESMILANAKFQYRKRDGLHAIADEMHSLFASWVSIPQAVWIACNSNEKIDQQEQCRRVSIPQAVWIACNDLESRGLTLISIVSIPQAVWIACNTVSQNPWKQWTQK